VDHLSRLQLADLALDPFPYNSHSTGIDVLWAGVPMVALLGDTFPGRVGASALRAAGLDELIASSVDEYYRLAMDLFGNPQRLQGLRRKAGREQARLPALRHAALRKLARGRLFPDVGQPLAGYPDAPGLIVAYHAVDAVQRGSRRGGIFNADQWLPLEQGCN
jgi:hypothetical protein